VGLTDLPVDPGEPVTPPDQPPQNPPPQIVRLSPDHGGDGTQVTLHGNDYQLHGPESGVMVGIEPASIVSWTPDDVVIVASQGANEADVGVAVSLRAADGQEVTGPDFTFTTAKSKKKTKADEDEAPKKEKDGKAKEASVPRVVFPTFPSGAGVMLKGLYKILVGPFELEAGQSYTLPMQCPNGLIAVVSGPCDITVMLG